MTALHVDPSIKQFNFCSELDYTMLPEGSIAIYEALIPTGKYKILKYSGDADSIVPTYGTQ